MANNQFGKKVLEIVGTLSTPTEWRRIQTDIKRMFTNPLLDRQYLHEERNQVGRHDARVTPLTFEIWFGAHCRSIEGTYILDTVKRNR